MEQTDLSLETTIKINLRPENALREGDGRFTWATPSLLQISS